MPAFESAVALGFRYVETDVHATADGVLVAFHDEALDRVTDRSGLIGELPWSEVRMARVAGREPIPLMEDIITTWPHLRVNIDPKHDSAVGPLVDLIGRTGSVDRVCIGSFSDRRLDRIREAMGPRLCTSIGPRGIATLKAAGYRLPVRLPAPCAQVPVSTRGVVVTDARLVAAAHRLDMQVHVWTIDDPIEMHRLLDLGVDGIMTDRPAVLREVLEARGQWPTT
ncbi:MAG: glycerophosphodiester phosphodiesterase [Acidimicrobiia bacterium]|nr:glycerophosphodiester phosphodiesterase [Acidimicrobiia bacterium]